MTNSEVQYVRTEDAPTLPAPISQTGVVGWIRQNLFFRYLQYHFDYFWGVAGLLFDCTIDSVRIY